MNTPLLSRHERRRQQTRRLLIQTALQLVLEKGYDAITIQDITERADLGRGTFYIHFKDKEDVIWSAIQDMVREMEQEAHQRYSLTTLRAEDYYTGLVNIYRHATQNRDLYRVVFGGQGSSTLTGRVNDLLAKVFLYDIQQAPTQEPRSVPDEFLAQMIVGTITRLFAWWLEKPDSYSPEQMASMTYEAIYRQKPPG